MQGPAPPNPSFPAVMAWLLWCPIMRTFMRIEIVSVYYPARNLFFFPLAAPCLATPRCGQIRCAPGSVVV